MGQTVNLLSFDFGGSNPSLPTNVLKKRMQTGIDNMTEKGCLSMLVCKFFM